MKEVQDEIDFLKHWIGNYELSSEENKEILNEEQKRSLPADDCRKKKQFGRIKKLFCWTAPSLPACRVKPR